MVTISFDPDAGTLYWYFTELIAGSTAGEAECAGSLLLDADGQVLGVELELDESITREDLALALAHPQVAYDRSAFVLTVRLLDEEPAEVQPLHESIILDFDATDRLQGCELLAAPEFGIAGRLERVAPFMVDLDADDDADAGDDFDDAGDDFDDAGDAGDGDDDFEDAGGGDDDFAGEGADGLGEDADGRAAAPTAAWPEGYRAGFVALIGKPNVGKSTLLNALLGQKVAIVSPKPQTTRMPLRGILTRPDAQVIFVDTPGIHDPRTKLGSFMVEQARRAIPDADVICFVVDITVPPGRIDQRVADMARRARAPRILVLNKVDQRNPSGQAHLDAYRALGPWELEIAVSAQRGVGLPALLDEIVRRLPPGPPHYPEDQVTDQSAREHAAELVREQVLRLTEQEVPHGVAVEIEEWEEKEQAVYIRMVIYVEKDSQKGIVIGARGAMLKRIGSAARRDIEAALGRPAYLDLWVKARPNWRDDPSSLHWLGYSGGDRS